MVALRVVIPSWNASWRPFLRVKLVISCCWSHWTLDFAVDGPVAVSHL